MSREALLVASTASRREKYLIYNTLNSIPLLLIGKAVFIDLRNETMLIGNVTDVDAYMNMTLNRVVYVNQKGKRFHFANFMVPARVIRQMQIPDSVNLVPELMRFLNIINTKKRPIGKRINAKVKRAMSSHQQTVDLIAKKVGYPKNF